MPEAAIVTTLVLAVLAHRLRAVTTGAAAVGLALGLATALATSYAPWALFVLFVISGSTASRLGADRKRALGVLQADEGRRGIEHALANCGAAALLVLLGRQGFLDAVLADLMAAGSLAAVFADTMASEFGTWLGGRPRDLLTLRTVPVGRDGAVTPIGLLAAAIAASLAGAIAALPSGRFGAALAVAAGGFAGNLVDSLLGSTIESRLGRYGGSIVNFCCSLAGAGVAAIV